LPEVFVQTERRRSEVCADKEPKLLKVPIGAVVEVVKREKEPRVVLGGRTGSNGSLANLRAVV
jgi:hypothetical protein